MKRFFKATAQAPRPTGNTRQPDAIQRFVDAVTTDWVARGQLMIPIIHLTHTTGVLIGLVTGQDGEQVKLLIEPVRDELSTAIKQLREAMRAYPQVRIPGVERPHDRKELETVLKLAPKLERAIECYCQSTADADALLVLREEVKAVAPKVNRLAIEGLGKG